MRVLQFSGGKDSLALLYLMQEEWDDLTVVWCNPGAPHESTLAVMDMVRKMVPHFLEVKGNQPLFLTRVGYPSDLVPASATVIGQAIEGVRGEKFASAYDCCFANLWQPMNTAMMLMGVTDIYRGQKSCDRRKAPMKHGYVENGVTYHLPLDKWSDQDVFDFLADRVPEHYLRGEKSSRDCWNCTAYIDENIERIRALPAKRRMFVMGKLASLLHQIDNSRASIAACLMTETANEHDYAS